MKEIRNRTVHTNGIEMHFVETGAGPLIVLCHGFPELSYSGRHQLPALAEAGYQVVALDQRGYGDTSRPAEIEAYDMRHLSGDRVRLRDAFRPQADDADAVRSELGCEATGQRLHRAAWFSEVYGLTSLELGS